MTDDALAQLGIQTETLAAARLAAGRATADLASYEAGEYADAERALGRAKVEAEFEIWNMGRCEGGNAEKRAALLAHELLRSLPYQTALTAYRDAERNRNALRTAAMLAEADMRAAEVCWQAARLMVEALMRIETQPA